MTDTQVNFKFVAVGDLVTESPASPLQLTQSSYKGFGVVLEVDEVDKCALVHWANYGSFWTFASNLIKVGKDV
tara:strand:+ start:6320 stop:6538 length:219 start_codon:yes stop_codon:yes gene_type:complete